jgi:hypothetical protein
MSLDSFLKKIVSIPDRQIPTPHQARLAESRREAALTPAQRRRAAAKRAEEFKRQEHPRKRGWANA